jgi:hypothetical protein
MSGRSATGPERDDRLSGPAKSGLPLADPAPFPSGGRASSRLWEKKSLT